MYTHLATLRCRIGSHQTQLRLLWDWPIALIPVNLNDICIFTRFVQIC